MLGSTQRSMQPRRLRPDNLTPPTRTPWGGRKILDTYKRDLHLGQARSMPLVGESWEVSVEPSFPSRLEGTSETLADLIAAHPNAWLGAKVAGRYGGQTPLLVKLLDTAANLSVQVHPAEDDPALGPGESGKPELWYILAANEGAGVYLGFAEGVTRRDVELCLRCDGPLDALMNFVEVKRGDAFLIEAGTAHAIGAGVTLAEPQFVTPGRHGITYRYWDWNRRYDARGMPSDTGDPRQLHVERSLAVTNWEQVRGRVGVEACRVTPKRLIDTSLCRELLVACSYFVVERWAGHGHLEVPALGTLLALTCVGGAAEIMSERGACDLVCGQSMVVPAVAGALRVTARPESAVELIVTRSP